MTPPPLLPTANGRARWSLLAALPALLLLAMQASWPWPFFSDDAFISLRYAARLLDGHGLTWTDGERVEGYSNLLWVLLCAGLGGLGVDLVTAARVLGAGCTAAACWLLARAATPHDARSTLRAALPPLLVAATQPVLVWTLGGLEGPLLLLLLAWGFGGVLRAQQTASPATWSTRQCVRLGAPFAFACWTRPDGPLWVFTAGLALIVGDRRAIPRVLWFGAPATVAVAAQLAFRLAYHGDFVPNTAHVKAELSASSLGPGLQYVGHALAAMPGLTACALLASLLLAVCRDTRTTALVLALPALAWFGYLAAIGGDHFPGRRLLHGVLPVLALAVGAALRTVRGRVAAAAFGLALAATAIDAFRARGDAQSAEAKSEQWEWQGRALGERLGRAFAAERPLLAVDAAGAVPFYSSLPALDLLGLCDRTIATTPFPAWLATTRPEIPKPPGHLRGNGRYVLERAPDLLLFSSPPGLPLPVFVSGAELEEEARFRDDYRCVLFDVPGLARPAPLWVRVDGKVGVRREARRIEIPAWLFGSYRLPEPLIRRHQPSSGDAAAETRRGRELAELAAWYGAAANVAAGGDGDGTFGFEHRAGPPPELTLHLAAGDYHQVEPPPAQARVIVAGTEPAVASAPLHISGDGPTNLRLLPAADGLPLRVARVVLERTGD